MKREAAERLLHWLYRIESVAAAMAYVIVAALLIGDVVGREIFGHGIFGAQKVAVYAAVVAGFLGLSLVTAANGQLRPAFMDNLFKGPMSQKINRLSDGFAGLFFLFMAIVALMFIQQSYTFGDKAAVLYWPLWPIQMVIPYALLSTGVRHGLFAFWPELKPVTGGETA